MNNFREMYVKFNSLVIFKGLLKNNVLQKFFTMLESLSGDTIDRVGNYASFVSELFNKQEDRNFTEYILECILDDENFYILRYAKGCKIIDAEIEKLLQNELKILQEIAATEPDSIRSQIDFKGFLPLWKTGRIDFAAEYNKRISNIENYGYGVFSKHHIFTVKKEGIFPVICYDDIRLSDLKGYHDERKAVVENTLSLLGGKPAANVLLYGDAGTGKSSTVKAIANEYKQRGLRLIEIKKERLNEIPRIMDEVWQSCLKFILFIDDLSFAKNGDEFGTLKAVIEGSVAARPNNVAIYATSNRRHLIKETFSDREGDDIHVNETMQELVSLSERFGKMVYFGSPDKEQYLKIVGALAVESGLDINGQDLIDYAERYALLRGGRSPRIARQLIESILSRNGQPE